MERAVEIFAIINLALVGLSHIVRPKAWLTFFADLRERGEAGVIFTAMLSLVFGSIIAGFHNVWSGIPLVLTLIGWAQVAKAAIYLLFPSFGLGKLRIPTAERAHLFLYPGFFYVAVAALLAYHLLTTAA